MLKKVTLALVLNGTLLTAVALPCSAESRSSVHLVTVSGKTWALTEVDHTRREAISKWNALRLKRGTLYHGFKVYDPKGPDDQVVVFDHKTYKANIKELRAVPDFRPETEKHPDVYRVNQVAQIITPVAVTLFDLVN